MATIGWLALAMTVVFTVCWLVVLAWDTVDRRRETAATDWEPMLPSSNGHPGR